MSPRHVTDQLPLWIEGDLEARESGLVETHLAACAECRAEAEALRESQVWLKAEAPPFGAEEREQLRREVLSRLQTPLRPARNAWWGAAALVSLAAAALLVLLMPSRPPRPVVSLPPAPAPAPAASAPVQPPAPPLATMAPAKVARRALLHPALSPLDADAGPGAARIEIQTSNPQIRIIWLARASAPEGSPHPI